MVVLPEPETPVTTVSRPLGMRTSRGLTVWIAPVDRRMVPLSNSSPFPARVRQRVSAAPERKGPIWEAGSPSMAGMSPWAMM